ncbi:MAG: hypothetical protein WC381_06630, partial [Kiritimatiellia bacterium]
SNQNKRSQKQKRADGHLPVGLFYQSVIHFHSGQNHPLLTGRDNSQLFRGTSYKVSGWTLLGQTQGWRRARQDFYQKHERPKQLWVRELRNGACQLLRRAVLPAAYGQIESARLACCTQSVEELRAMEQHFGQISDFRGREGYYSLSGLMAIIACATQCLAHETWQPLPRP